MDEEKAKQYLLKCLKRAGVPVIMNKQEMERILSESTEDAYEHVLLQKMVFSYEEGSAKPDLSPSTVSFLDKNGNEKAMYSVKFYGNRPKGYIPKRIGKAYKLMEQWPDGTLHALFAGTQETYPMNQWDWAKGFVPDEPKSTDKNYRGIQSMNLAPRFGWHMGTGVPSTHHLMGVGDVYHPVMCYPSKSGIGHPNGSKRVWVEVSYDATEDYTPVAEANPSTSEKDIRGLVPFGGYYMFQESNLSNWIVASSIRFDRVIPEEERQAILKNAGYDEELVWRQRVVRPKIKGEMTRLIHKMEESPNQQTAEKISKLIQVARGNERFIRTLSHGEAPIFSEESLRDMAAIVADMQSHPDSQISNLAVLKAQREQLESDFAKNYPDFQRKRLTKDESDLERQRIRDGIFENPEYLDAQETKALSMNRHGQIQGFVYNHTVYLDPDQIRLDTPIHEYTHLWDSFCQKKHPALWKEGVKLLKQTKLWQEVKESPFYRDIAQDDDLIASEVHARLAGLQGAELMKAAKCEKVLAKKLLNWGKRFWTFVRGATTKGHAPMPLDKFIQAPMADLVAGRNISVR